MTRINAILEANRQQLPAPQAEAIEGEEPMDPCSSPQSTAPNAAFYQQQTSDAVSALQPQNQHPATTTTSTYTQGSTMT